jgi:hypothetical protein
MNWSDDYNESVFEQKVLSGSFDTLDEYEENIFDDVVENE